MSIKIALIGATGVMGQLVANEIEQDDALDLHTAISTKNNENIIDRFSSTNNLNTCVGADVIIDFSLGMHTLTLLNTISTFDIPYVLCATGQSENDIALIHNFANTIPLLIARNTSRAVNVLFYLAEQASKVLKDYDIDILERHHTRKVDAPSGSALTLGQHAAQGANIPWPQSANITFDCAQIKGRPGRTINFTSQRAGNLAGEHQISFTNSFERLIIEEHCFDRRVFASGAIEAAIWLKDKPKGLYSMFDVLGLKKEIV